MLVSCPQCNGTVSDKAHTCPHCGFQIDTLIKCPDCGKLVPPGTTACPGCGYPFGAISKTPEIRRPPEPADASLIAPPAPIPQTLTKTGANTDATTCVSGPAPHEERVAESVTPQPAETPTDGKTAISRGAKRVWYYEVHGVVYGPVSADTIYSNIVNGELLPDVNVWMTGSSEWTPAVDRVFFTEQGPDAEDVAWQDSLAESGELPPMVSRDGNTAYHLYSAAGEAASQPRARSDDIGRSNDLQRSRGYDTPDPSSSRYAIAGGSSIAYAVYIGVLSPWIAASDMRSSVGGDAIAANSDTWAAAMAKLWGISLALGAVFMVIGIAILRVKDNRSKRILTWCGVAAVLLIWLVETAIGAKNGGTGSPMLGFYDILYEGVLLGALFSKRKVGQEQDPAATGDDQPQWRYRDKSGRTSFASLSTDELRREIASGRLSRDVEVWTEGTGKWRPASSYVAFSKEKIGSSEQ